MIVIARNFGQLGNRLLLSSNLIAAACQYDVPLFNPSFARYAHYFQATSNDLWCRFPVRNRPTAPSPIAREMLYRSVYLTGRTLSHLRMTSFPFHIVRVTPQQTCDLQSDAFARKATGRRPVLVSGWKFDAGDWIQKHADSIRSVYRIADQHQSNVDGLMAQARARGSHVVGVHIRQGDYARFENGRYFYSIDQYAAAMRRIRERMADRDVVFLVCGNVPLADHDFGDLNVCFGTGHMIEDMYAFAAADTVIGPPSTYTGWASFYGRVPMRWMSHAEETFDQIDPPYWSSPVGSTNTNSAPTLTNDDAPSLAWAA
ncbi:hypothetical protein Poly51_16360 [Rubripirellula tenax]|uniref:Glycosyl transferase family 11 n=1 Tax=Rubripirellula tenax TaxID=2528015 RepID=A0A5C6FFD6_9BACT|nr:hypothetical protein [Rubripirellula tenax]TWU58856.1 hypothetical protein Poly51_16360 [Rubripirellula tenax]